jgi:cation transport regulator ChaB
MARSTDYLEAFIEKVKGILPKEWFDKIHRMARGIAGGKAFPAKEVEKGGALHVNLKPDGKIELLIAKQLGGSQHPLLQLGADGLLMFGINPVQKAMQNEVRQILQAALEMKYPAKNNGMAAWVMELPAPAKGEMIFCRDGKNFICDYEISESDIAFSNEREAMQVWEEKGGGEAPIAKVYASIDDLPEATKALPKRGKEIFLAAFNSAFKQYKGDESKCFPVAWAAVKAKFEEKDGKWVAKSESKEIYFPIFKADEAKQIIYGIVADADDEIIADWIAKGQKAENKPDLVDTQGDWHSEDELDTACENFMADYQVIDKQHKDLLKGARIVQCAVLQKGTVWPEADSKPLKYKSWVMATKVEDKKTWEQVKKGEITGFSLAGFAERN